MRLDNRQVANALIEQVLASWMGVEGEVTGIAGISQNLQFGAIDRNLKPPKMVGYTGSVVFSLPTGSSVIRYAAGGVAELTVLDAPARGIGVSETLLTGNAGGGLRWHVDHRCGVRADDRFLAIQNKDDGAQIFGRDPVRAFTAPPS